jgi:hypothetical protein
LRPGQGVGYKAPTRPLSLTSAQLYRRDVLRIAMTSHLPECRISADDRVFFLHIPKTAGTTLNRFLRNQFDRRRGSRRYSLRSPEDWSTVHDFDYIHAHVPYGMMCEMLGVAPLCITMLRDPIERSLSQVAERQRGRSNKAKLRGDDLSLKARDEKLANLSVAEILEESSLIPSYLGINAQVFYLGTAMSAGRVREARARGERTWGASAEPGDLEGARARLEEFAFVGLTERFQESLFLLCYTFGWRPMVDLPRLRVSADRPRREQLSAGALERIRDLNALDLELFAAAERLFEARYAQMTEELLDLYGDPARTSLPRPLAQDVVYELLVRHHERRNAERGAPRTPAAAS